MRRSDFSLLFGEDGEFIAFVPFAHLLYVGTVTDDGQMVW
jgi:hypothetical protein